MLMIGAVIGRFMGLATVDIAQAAGKRWSPGAWDIFMFNDENVDGWGLFCFAVDVQQYEEELWRVWLR